MTIPFEEFMAELLADPEVKRKYDALASEFEFSAELLRARPRRPLSSRTGPAHGHQPVGHCTAGKRKTLPSTKTLLRFAEATGSKIQLRLLAA